MSQPIDPQLVEKWRKVHALSVDQGTTAPEREAAAARLAKMEAQHPGLRAAAMAPPPRGTVFDDFMRAAQGPGPWPQPQAGPSPRPGPRPEAPRPEGPRAPFPGSFFHRTAQEQRKQEQERVEQRKRERAEQQERERQERRQRNAAPKEEPGIPLGAFFSRAASAIGNVARDLGAGLSLRELANAAKIEIEENARSVTIKVRISQADLDEAAAITGGSHVELVTLLSGRFGQELSAFLASPDEG